VNDRRPRITFSSTENVDRRRPHVGSPFNMALHEALSYSDWERALHVIQDRLANPDADVPGLDEVFGGKLALHVACENGAPVTVVEKLMAAVPDSTSVPAEPCGRLPLHFAVGAGVAAPTECVELLLKEFGSQGGLAVDENGRTPLHLACTNAELCLPEAFDLLLTYAPAATAAVDRRGCTPLHLAAGDGTITQVQRLLAAAPQAVDTADGTNKLPIHWAAMKESPTQVTELLLTTNPTSISQLDKNGKAPLHLIAKNNSKIALEKAEMLLKACPASVRKKGLFWAINAKNDHLTKTGSGQI
jgi:ankyrin repeat protein